MKNKVEKLGEFELNKIYCMDCLEGLKKIPDNSVDLVVIDPPYFVLNTVKKIQKKAKKWDNFKNIEEFEKFTTSYLKSLYEILKEDCQVFLFWGERHLFLFDKIIKKTNFKLRKILIWHYPNILKGFSNKKWHNTFDFIFHLGKGDKLNMLNASFVNSENIDVWNFPKPQFNYKKDKKYHSTQKPLKLISRLIKMFSNKRDVVLDCFMGSGTTAVACKQLNRKFIGFEIGQEYIDIANKRLSQETLHGVLE